MDKEYSWNDIIINPTSEGVEEYIGKKCYFSDNPTHCLNNANKKDNYYCDILEEISIGRRDPFIFKRQKHAASCIILKKEEPKSKYIPFESAKDLIESYQRSEEGFNRDTFEDNLASYGIWVRDKATKSLCQVMSITDNAVAMYGKKALYSESNLSVASVVSVSFKDLLNDYEFLDSSPCGKLEEGNTSPKEDTKILRIKIDSLKSSSDTNEPAPIAHEAALPKKYSWLIPCDIPAGESSVEYDCNYSLADRIPKGWMLAFGDKMLEELDKIIKKYNVEDYRVEEIEVECGCLEWCDTGFPAIGYAEYITWLNKYKKLSTETCISCGKPAIGLTKGYTIPLCKDCMGDLPYDPIGKKR